MRIEELSSPEEQVTSARSRLYRLLAQGFSYPDRTFFATLAGGAFRREVEETWQALPAAPEVAFESLTAADEYVDFQAEYLRHFDVGVGAPPCPLYSGLYHGGRKGTMEELMRFYNFFGLSVERGGGELPDHLTTELEFMHFLAFKELWALHHGDEPSPYRRAQVDFLERQLLSWLPLLRARLARLRSPVFYSTLLDMTLAFATEDVAYLRAALNGHGENRLVVQSAPHQASGGES